MKANEAPEKLYIHRTPHLGLLAASEMNITGEDIEYTRTDAFIEKACEWLADNARAFDEGDIYNAEDLIEHFKNYLKGE